MNELKGKTAIVTGGSRGFGRGMVEALAAQNMQVYVIARNKERLAALRSEIDGRVETISADVTDAIAAGKIMQEIHPNVLILNANEESQAQNLGIRFHTILPKLTPETELDQAAVVAYAKRGGVSVEQFLEKMGPPLTPAMAGEAIVTILTHPEYTEQVAYLLTAEGLQPIN